MLLFSCLEIIYHNFKLEHITLPYVEHIIFLLDINVLDISPICSLNSGSG